MFMGDSNGEGISLVLYFKLSEDIETEVPTDFVDSIKVLTDIFLENFFFWGGGIAFGTYCQLESAEISETFFPSFINAQMVENESGKVQGSSVSFRERLKVLAGEVNHLQLSAGERRLLNAYKDKPGLTRPRHEFFKLGIILLKGSLFYCSGSLDIL